MRDSNQNSKAILGTIIFHILLIIVLYAFGFTTPLPLPAEEGILVNFGDQDFGLGDLEPKVAESQKSFEDKSSEQIVGQEEDGYVTQDIEDAPELNQANEEKKAAEEKKRQEEIDRKRKEELEKLRKEQEEKERKQKEIDNMITNAFSKGKDSEEDSKSEGITNNSGNQGNISGSIHSDDYTNINSSGDGGISYSLDGRNPLKLPEPTYNYQVEGKVVVEVTVDQNGKVTKAVPGVKGSTTLDENLLQSAKEAALKAVFDVKFDAPAYQKGTITYYFKLK